MTTKTSSYFKYSKTKDDKNLIFDLFSTLLIFFIMALIISNPKQFSSGTISGVKLFFFSVFPGLFPFMFLTKLLTELGFVFKISSKFDKFSKKIFGTPGVSIYALFLSLISGYPIGAKTIYDLYEKKLISEFDAKKMSVFCTTSGPIFVIGSIGCAMFGSFKIGLIIYFSHITSSIILGVLFNLFSKKNQEKQIKFFEIQPEKKENLISFCLTETINSLFVVGGFITLFYLVSEIGISLKIFDFLEYLLSPIFSIFGLEKNLAQGILFGIVEVTRGAKFLSSTASISSIVAVCGILSFSGLSIIFQSMSFLKKAKIKTHFFVFSKSVHAIFSMIICLIFCVIFW